MFNFRNMFYIAIVLSFVLFSNVACSDNDKKQDQPASKDQGNVEIASADTPSDKSENIPVFNISSVGQAEKGKAVDFSWVENGETRQFSKVTDGKVVFLNFWGTWCPPCRREIPDIIEISKDLKDKDFIIVGVAMERNPNNAMDKVKNYVKAKGIPYINVLANQQIVSAYGGVQAVPTTIIIDKNGNIAERIVGMRNKAQFMQSINNVLDGKAQ